MNLRLLTGLCVGSGVLLAGASDAVANSIVATCTPGPCGAWQRSAVQIDWQVQVPGISRERGCQLDTFTAEGVHARTCEALDIDNNPLFAATATIRIDMTPPAVMSVERAPGPNVLGWHTTPLTATFVGIDPGPPAAVSGIHLCTKTTYQGPDSPLAQVTGTCVDRAGNQSAPRIETFQYDATAPELTGASADIGDRMLRIRWSETDGPIEVARIPGVGTASRSVVFNGSGRSFTDRRVKNLVSYRYEVTSTDQAGNQTVRTVTAKPVRKVLSPINGAKLNDPPLFRWSEIQNAGYYNVQLFRGSQKVLSTWPRTESFQLKRRWRFGGQSIQLAPGTYRAYVWPGFGAFAKQRYGRIVGTVTFTVT